MNNEEMFLTILNRMDNLESSLNGRMDNLESSLNGRIDKLDSDIDLEFYAVRKEMDEMNKLIQKQINVLDSKVDRLMFTKDVEGYDKINIRFEVLERGYRELKAKIN